MAHSSSRSAFATSSGESSGCSSWGSSCVQSHRRSIWAVAPAGATPTLPTRTTCTYRSASCATERGAGGVESAPDPLDLAGHLKVGFDVARCGQQGREYLLDERLEASPRDVRG